MNTPEPVPEWAVKAEANQRLEIATRVLAGFASNPSVFQSREDCGWALCNCTDEDLVGYALSLADKMIEGEKVTAAKKQTAQSNAQP